MNAVISTDNNLFDTMSVELKREIMYLLRHRLTAWYGSVILLGKTELSTDYPTAWTNGYDCSYNPNWFATKTRGQRRWAILHENFHKAFMHLPYYQQYWKLDAKTANIACDQIVNNLIYDLYEQDPELVEPIPGMICDRKYKGWSVPEVWEDIYKPEPCDGDSEGDGESGDGESEDESEDEGQGQGKGGSSMDDGCMDEHDWESATAGDGDDDGDGSSDKKLSAREIERQVKEALQQGGILAGRMGATVPREFHEVMEPKVDWREVMREFITASISGRDEGSWRKYNKRMLPLDYLYPTSVKETPTELIVAIDLSGSIGDQVNMFTAELISACETAQPDKVRVLWWDTDVQSEQVFEVGQYENMRDMLKPVGGGGTRVGCVSDYIVANQYKPDCVLVFTDGYLESSEPVWDVTAPTLWLVMGNPSFTPPANGKSVTVPKEV